MQIGGGFSTERSVLCCTASAVTCARWHGWKRACSAPTAGPLPAGYSALGLTNGPGALPAGRSRAHLAASAAADFAAKEAFLKAAGTGLREPFSLCEIEALRLDSGAPVYRFTGETARWVEQQKLAAHLSLSHDGGMALAFCVLERTAT